LGSGGPNKQKISVLVSGVSHIGVERLLATAQVQYNVALDLGVEELGFEDGLVVGLEGAEQ